MMLGLKCYKVCRKNYKQEAGQNASAPDGIILWTKDNQILLISAYTVALFTVMYITVYSLEAFTFYRGVGIAVLFVLILLSQMEYKRIFAVCLLCYAIGLCFVPQNMVDFNTERYLAEEEMITEAEYLVFSLKEKAKLRADWLEQSHDKLFKDNMDILQNDYFIQYYDEDYVVY
ncbi:MAG: hypothetical protein E7299_00325 [Lachnospiraceae bacterium]|nr:hypothetical protein [Lachnospiraceae bacterium]